MKNKEEKIPWWVYLIGALIVVVMIGAFIGSLGNVDLGKKGVLPDEFKADRKKAKLKHDAAEELLTNQEELKKRLDRRFRWIYLAVRVLFVGMWLSLLWLGCRLGYVSDLEDALNFSQASLLIVFTLSFLAFGSITNLNKTLDHIKMRLENWIYGKSSNLNDLIAGNRSDIAKQA